jgi:ribosomal protein L15E
MMHHEFASLGGELVAIDLPVVRYTNDERLYEIIATYEAHGCPVSDPHTCIIERGGMKKADYRHLAYKKRLDPRGLLNSGKSEEWPRVKDMEPDAIEALQDLP